MEPMLSVSTMAPVIHACPHLRGGTWCNLIRTDCESVEACVYKLTHRPADEPVATCASQSPAARGPGKDQGLLRLIGKRLVT